MYEPFIIKKIIQTKKIILTMAANVSEFHNRSNRQLQLDVLWLEIATSDSIVIRFQLWAATPTTRVLVPPALLECWCPQHCRSAGALSTPGSLSRGPTRPRRRHLKKLIVYQQKIRYVLSNNEGRSNDVAPFNKRMIKC